MTVVEILDESDLDNAQFFYESINWGLSECRALEVNGYNIDLWVLTNSSHGSGVFGFGGDESGNVYSLSIKDIKLKLTLALHNNNLIKFDVIGFDACVMQSWAVLGELASVTHYVLASVALEPGHGWDYS